MATYTSRFGVRKNNNIYLYTKGKEYSLNGIEYIGEYHLDGNIAKVGPVVDPEALPLQRYYANKDHYIYDKQYNFNPKVLQFTLPVYFAYTPIEQAYLIGYDTRFFVEKINDDQSYAIEIDEKQFRNINKKGGIDGGIYAASAVQWQLTGYQKDITINNELSLLQASVVTPSVQYAVKNYTEFARFTLA